jgi:hypothetical protein
VGLLARVEQNLLLVAARVSAFTKTQGRACLEEQHLDELWRSTRLDTMPHLHVPRLALRPSSRRPLSGLLALVGACSALARAPWARQQRAESVSPGPTREWPQIPSQSTTADQRQEPARLPSVTDGAGPPSLAADSGMESHSDKELEWARD